MTPQIVFRTSTTETLYFMNKPDYATRRSLKAAGWKYAGNGRWFRNQNSATVLKQRDFAALVVPVQAEPATAEPSAN